MKGLVVCKCSKKVLPRVKISGIRGLATAMWNSWTNPKYRMIKLVCSHYWLQTKGLFLDMWYVFTQDRTMKQ